MIISDIRLNVRHGLRTRGLACTVKSFSPAVPHNFVALNILRQTEQ